MSGKSFTGQRGAVEKQKNEYDCGKFDRILKRNFGKDYRTAKEQGLRLALFAIILKGAPKPLFTGEGPGVEYEKLFCSYILCNCV